MSKKKTASKLFIVTIEGAADLTKDTIIAALSYPLGLKPRQVYAVEGEFRNELVIGLKPDGVTSTKNKKG